MNNKILKGFLTLFLIEITGFSQAVFAAIVSGAEVYDGVNANILSYSDYQSSSESGVSVNASWSSQHTNNAGGTATYSGTATATTSYGGVFKASADVTITNYNYQTYYQACPDGRQGVCVTPAVRATSLLGDAFQIVKGASSSEISQGFLVMTIDVDGSSTLSTNINEVRATDATGSFWIWDGSTRQAPVEVFNFTGPETLTTSPIPIRFGEFKDFNFSLRATATPFDAGRSWTTFEDFLSIDTSSLVPYDFSATLSFGNTATITNIQIFADETLQNEILDFQILSGSGAYYPGGTSVVPVPPAVWLFGSGLIGLIGIARRKRS